MAFNLPEGIEKDVNVRELEDFQLEKYHDVMHIFWKKIEEGVVENFNWTFREVYEIHRKVVLKMIKRKLVHLSPINSLDQIPLTSKGLKDIYNLLK